MIPEVPVGAGQEPDVWSHSDKQAAGLQRPMRLIKGASEGGLVRQVLEEITGEDGVQTRFFDGPWLGTVLPDELHIVRQVAWCIGIEVHGIFSSGMNLIDELPVAATQVEDSCIPRHVLLEERVDEHAPDTLAVIEVRRKALGVDAAEISFVMGKRH